MKEEMENELEYRVEPQKKDEKPYSGWTPTTITATSVGFIASVITIVSFIVKLAGVLVRPEIIGIAGVIAVLCWIALTIRRLTDVVKELRDLRQFVQNITIVQKGTKSQVAISEKGNATPIQTSGNGSPVASDGGTVSGRDTKTTTQSNNIVGGDMAGENITKK